MEWYLLDQDYLNYLREYDQFVPNVEGYDGKFKPFFGKLFSTANLDYYAPISSGKNKHILLRETSFFYKVYLHNETDAEKSVKKPVAVIDLKHIVPVPSKYAKLLLPDDIMKNDSYGSLSEKSKYLVLLRQELAWVKRNEEAITKNAVKLREKCLLIESYHTFKKCLNLKLLEEKAVEYKKEKT